MYAHALHESYHEYMPEVTHEYRTQSPAKKKNKPQFGLLA